MDYVENASEDDARVHENVMNGTLTPLKSKYPHFSNIPSPSIDVTLAPGDILTIPAFWFHHIENGYNPTNSIDEDSLDESGGCRSGADNGVTLPSVSVNSFSLSQPMMMAQQIFQKASLQQLRLARTGSNPTRYASSVLNVLGTNLIKGLVLAESGKETEYIRKYLLDARYGPLLFESGGDRESREDMKMTDNHQHQPLSEDQIHELSLHVEMILPDFHQLLASLQEGQSNEESGDDNDGIGVMQLIALHLLELWAVELVGASSVAESWEGAVTVTR